MLVIVANIVTLSMYGFPPPSKELRDFITSANAFFVCVFVVESVLFQIAMSPFVYWTNVITAFDGIVAVASLVELALPGGNSVATVLRSFRLLRVFKLARTWYSFRMLLKCTLNTMLSLGNFIFLLIIVTVVFSLMGQNMFALQLTFDEDGYIMEQCQGDKWFTDEKCWKDLCPIEHGSNPTCVPRCHFDSFLWAFVTVFQILSLENWNVVMYNALQANGAHSVLYFLCVIVSGSLICMNLFIAIIMCNFEEQSTRMISVAAQEQHDSILRKQVTKQLGPLGLPPEDVWSKSSLPCFPSRSGYAEYGTRQRKLSLANEQQDDDEDSASILIVEESASISPRPHAETESNLSYKDRPPATDDGPAGAEAVAWERVRQKCYALSRNKRFDLCVLLMIVACTIMLILSNPLQNPYGDKAAVLYAFEWVVTIFFALEMVVKLIGLGVRRYVRSGWNCLDAVIVLASMVDLLPLDTFEHLSALKVLRLMRTLRPLRMINRNQNLKVVINTLLKSLPQLCNLLIVCGFFFLVFGLIGISLFSGGLYECKDVSFETIPLDIGAPPHNLCINPDTKTARASTSCPESYVTYTRPTAATPLCVIHCDSSNVSACNASPWGYHIARCSDCQQLLCPAVDAHTMAQCEDDCRDADSMFCADDAACIAECVAQCVCAPCEALMGDAARCVELGHRWLRMNNNFDSVGSAMVTLFSIATTEGWVDTMYAGVDSRGPYSVAERDHNEWRAVFFVVFVTFGSFFVLNLCVGVIIDHFNRLKAENGGLLMTQAQVTWVDSQEAFFTKTAFFARLMSMDVPSLPPYRKSLFFVVMSDKFDRIIMAAICANTVSMMLPIHPPPYPWWSDAVTWCNIVFAMLFNAEAILKIVALRRVYFADSWNRFDFFCVVSTDIGVLVQYFLTIRMGGVLTILRLLRMARVFRLVRFFRGLNQLFTTLFMAIPKFVNVGAILALLLFVYVVLGVQMFAKAHSFGPIDDHANFRDVWRGLLTLIRIMTGEGWTELMHAYGKSKWFFESALEQHCEESMVIVTAAQYYYYEKLGLIDAPIECGDYLLSMVFFMSYTLAVSFVILNLFIAVIMDGFDDSAKAVDRISGVISSCLEIWKRYDKEYKLKLPVDDAFTYINEVIKSLGTRYQERDSPTLTRQYSRSLRDARVLQLRVTADNMVHFNCAALAVLRHVLIRNNDDILSQLEALEKGDMKKPKTLMRKEKRFKKVMRKLGCRPLEENMAALRIQQRLKKRSLARTIREAIEMDEGLTDLPNKHSTRFPSPRRSSSPSLISKQFSAHSEISLY